MDITYKQSRVAAVSERFAVESTLGSGGFGVVYRAFDRRWETHVALKTLHETNPGNLYRFKQEFRALAGFSHPNLITLYELISEGSLWYFTMELVDGVDWLTWVDPPAQSSTEPSDADALTPTVDTASLESPDSADICGRRPPQSCTVNSARLRDSLAQLTRAMVSLHRFGKLHRDIKPSNVLVESTGRIVLLDFGMITDVAAAKSPVQKLERQSQPGQVRFAGTPRYMSPEQALGGNLAASSDWYAVGAMLYEALTGGRPPIEGPAPLQTLLRKQTVDPDPVSAHVNDPPADLAELAMALLARDPARRPTGTDMLALLGLDRPSAGPATPPRQVCGRQQAGFVGRAELLERLDRGFRRCIQARQLTVASVSGPSGLGKTALVRHFLDSLDTSSRRPIVLEGRCYQNESVPYKALDNLVDALSAELQRFSAADIADWLAGDVDALTRVFPVLRRACAIRAALDETTIEYLDSKTLRSRAFRALRNLLDGVARNHPLVLFIDDIQWGDEDSAILLEALLSPPAPPFFLVTTWRSQDAQTSELLKHFLPALQTMGETVNLLDVPVGPLDDSEAIELVEHLVDDDQHRPPQWIESLARDAAGNPFFIDELARFSTLDNPGPGAHTSSLGEVIGRRVDLLGRPAQTLLEVLAIAGQPVDRQIARRVAGLAADGQTIVAKLRSVHLVRSRSSPAHDWLEPYHGRIGEVLLARLTAEQRLAYHGRLAQTYEDAGGADPETLARHFAAAGQSDKAARYTLTAATRASETLAFERAARLYQKALELGDWTTRMQVDILSKMGRMFGFLGRSSRAGQAFRRAADLDDTAGSLDARIQSADQLLRCGQVHQGLAVLETVLRKTGFEPPAFTGQAIASIVWNQFRLSQRDFDIEPTPTDEIAPATLSRIEALWTAAKMLGVIDPMMGAYYHYHTIHDALDAGSAAHLALSFCQQAAQVGALGPTPAAAERLFERARQFTDMADDPAYAAGYVRFTRGFIHYTDGHFKRGRQLMGEGRQILVDRCSGVVWETTTFQFFGFFPTYWLGDLAEFARKMPGMLDDAVARDDRFHTVALRSWLYMVHLGNDRPDRARQDLDQAQADWTRKGYHMQHFWYLQGAIETALYEGDGRRAWQLLRSHRGPLKRSFLLKTQIIQQIVWHLTSRCAVAALRQTDGFVRRWWLRRSARRALAKLRDAPQSGWLGPLADLVEAQWLIDGGQHEAAIDLLTEAEDGFRQADMSLYLHACRRRLGDLLGGGRGGAMRQAADASMADIGIEHPAAMTAMLTGGPRQAARPTLAGRSSTPT